MTAVDTQADLAALLALGAALFIAIGNVIHQRSARQVTDATPSQRGFFGRLLRDRRWWLGSLVAAAGFGLQAAALARGSVLLVQALLVTSLLFALPINARLDHRRLTAWELVWAVLLAGSVAVVVTVGNPTPGHARAALATWTVVVVVLAPVLVLCLIGARLCAAGPRRAVLLAVVSGALWGVFAVLTKGVVARLGDGIGALLSTPEFYAWMAVGVAGTAFQQSAFRAGALTASLPTMTVAEPVVASVLGVIVLGETLRPGDSGWLVLIVAITAMVLATAALAGGRRLPAGAH